MHRISRLFGGRFVLLTTRGGVVGLNFVATFLLAAVLSPADFGRFVFLWAVASLLSTLAAIGGHNYLIREASARQVDPAFGVTKGEALVIAVILPSIAVLGVAGLMVFLGPTVLQWFGRTALPSVDIGLVSAVAFLQVLLSHAATPFRIADRQTFSMLVRDAGPHLILILSAGAAVAVGQRTPAFVLMAFSAISVLTVTVLLFVAVAVLRNGPPLWRGSSGRRGGGLLHFWGFAVLGMLSSQIDILLGGLVLGNEALGRYQILKRLANLTGLPLIVANWIVIVDVGRAYASQNFAEIQSVCRTGSRLALLPAIVLALLSTAALPGFLWFFGVENSMNTWAVFLLLLAGAMASVFFGMDFIVATQCGKERFALFARMSGMAATGLIILAQGHGLTDVGLAASFFGAAAASNLILVYWIRRTMGVDTSVLCLLSKPSGMNGFG